MPDSLITTIYTKEQLFTSWCNLQDVFQSLKPDGYYLFPSRFTTAYGQEVCFYSISPYFSFHGYCMYIPVADLFDKDKIAEKIKLDLKEVDFLLKMEEQERAYQRSRERINESIQ